MRVSVAWLLGVLILGTPTSSILAAPKPTPPKATVIFRVDGVLVKKAKKGKTGKKRRRLLPAYVRTKVKVGDMVATRSHSRAEIHLGDGVLIRLKENSVLRIRQVEFKNKVAKVSVKLWAGRALLKIAKTFSPGSRIQVRTPAAVAAVRGTMFAVEVAKPSQTDIKVLEGTVQAAALSGGQETSSRDVEAGKEVAAHEGQALPEPVEMSAQEMAEETKWAEEPEMEAAGEEETSGESGESEEAGAEEESESPEVIEPESTGAESPEVEESAPAESSESDP